jgi:uncharacterized protein (DUF2141 family)
MKMLTGIAFSLLLLTSSTGYAQVMATTGAAETVVNATITLEIIGVKRELGGNIVVTVFKGKDGFLDADKAYRTKNIKVTEDADLSLQLAAIPLGVSYAIQAHHDANENGKMDMRWFPFPKSKEGGGFSNNYIPSSKPKYDKAAFDLNAAELSIAIAINY